MRSLTLRFTLAFLLVGIIVVAFVGTQFLSETRGEFSQFLLNRDQQILLASLQSFYEETGSWEGISQVLQNNTFFESHTHDVALLDANGEIVFGDSQELGESELDAQIPVEVNGQLVGTLLVESEGITSFENLSAESQFLQRLTASTGTILAIAIMFSFMVGSLLARSMSRPIRELTQASQQIASGDFGQQVQVRSRDEIGRLAESFNKMSTFVADSTRQRKQMTADIAHELRTPLSILSGYTEGLNDGTLQADANNLDILASEVKLLNRLVEDLRILSLSDAGELTLQKTLTPIGPLMEKIVLAQAKAAEEKGLEIELKQGENLSDLLMDQERMAQVFKNLLANAIRYSPEGKIRVSTFQSNESLQIAFKDEGPGISQADIPHLFDRFYRADDSRSRAEDGSSGLGLAIVKAIVQAHGGSIDVHSEIGQGATFTVKLPL